MEYTVTNWQEAILAAGSSVLADLISFLPNLLGAVLIFLIGWIIAGWAKTLVAKLLEAAKLQKAVEGTTVEKFLQKTEWRGRAEDIIGSILRWIIIFIFFIATVNVLGLSTVSTVLNNILAYIPTVISATLILLVGVLFAGFVESLIKGTTGAFDVSTSRLLGKIASWIIMVFSLLAAISELGIAAQFINIIITGVVATLSIGLGLALGLGSKDLVNTILTEWYQKIKKDLDRK